MNLGSAMSDLHIEDFYRDVALILSRLYATFPRRETLYVEDISGPDQPDEFGLHAPRFAACFSTMLWLAQQDYLHFENTVRQEALDQAVLSHRAFLALSSPSNTDDPASPSLLHCLRQALREGSSSQVRRWTHQLMLQARLLG